MPPITTEQQQELWAIDATLLSDNGKTVFQLMSDTGATYDSDAATTISTELGGSLDTSEVSAALNELWTKGYIEVQSFVPRYPAVLPAPIA